MADTDNWKSLHSLTAGVVAKLIARREAEFSAGPFSHLGTGDEAADGAQGNRPAKQEGPNHLAKNPSANRELKNDGGTAKQGRSASAAAKCPRATGGAHATPSGRAGNRTGEESTIAKAAGEKVAAATKAGRTRAAAVRSAAGGESSAGNSNVIDYREHVKLFAVWGPRGDVPHAHRAASFQRRPDRINQT